jgi:FlaA1/EpsC-like NDP-sugar epimerase
MIRLLNVYYPTRTVLLLLCEAAVVSSCFLVASLILLGPDTLLVLNYEFGFWKIAAITVLSLLLSYYFDLYEPQIVSARDAIYFRILMVVGFDCFAVSALLHFFPDLALSSGRVFALGLLFLTPVLIAWRRAYGWVVSLPFLRERVYVLGAGASARSIVQTIQERPDLGMEVVDWHEVPLPAEERKLHWCRELEAVASGPKPISRIIVAMEMHRRTARGRPVEPAFSWPCH